MNKPFQTTMKFRGMKIPVMSNATKSEILDILNRMLSYENITTIQAVMDVNGKITIHEW